MTRRYLATHFGLLGAFLGKYPLASASLFLLAIFMPSLLGFWLGLRLQIGLDEGFVPWNAPSIREISIQKQFFGENDQSKEWYMALFGIARPKDNGQKGNMLDPAYFEEFNGFYEELIRMELDGPRGNFTYAGICSPLCEINDQIQKLMDYSWLAKVHYPVSRVFSYDVNIGKHVFNRTVNSRGDLVGAEYIAFYFTSFIRDELRAKELALFEKTIVEQVKVHNSNGTNRVELIGHGSNGVQAEMSRGVMDAARNKLFGLLLGTAVFLALHALSGWLHSQFPFRRLLLALLCLPLIALGQFASLSLLSLLGFSVNLLHFTSPLLCLALLFTAHGTFQLADCWCRLLSESKRKQFSASERLASTFEQAAPSFLCSQLGPILAFALLWPILPAQHYRSFCLGLLLLLLFCFLLQIALFAPILARFCHHQIDHVRFINGSPAILEFGPNDPVAVKKPSIAEHPPIVKLRAKNGHELIPAATNGRLKMSKKRREQRGAIKKQLRLAVSQRAIFPLADFLRSNFPGRFLVLSVSILLLWLALFRGLPALENEMDYRHLLPRDSSAIAGFDLMNTIWNDFLQILYIVNRPPDFEDPVQFGHFKEFLSAATALPQTLPPDAHMSWLFDYYRDRLNTDLFQRISSNFSHETVNMSKFDGFINGFPYRAWQSGVRYTPGRELGHNQTQPSIDRMLVLLAYNDTLGLSGKRRIINQCREVAKRFPQFGISIFDTDLRTADIMDTIEPFLWRSLAGLVVGTSLAVLLVLWHFGCFLLAILLAISTITHFIGLGQLLGFQLDLLNCPTAISICSISVQLGAQFLGELLSCWAKEDPFRHALVNTASTAKSLLLWLALALPPLLLAQVPFFGLQAKLLLLGAILAFWHGIFLLPTLAGLLPRTWLQ